MMVKRLDLGLMDHFWTAVSKCDCSFKPGISFHIKSIYPLKHAATFIVKQPQEMQSQRLFVNVNKSQTISPVQVFFCCSFKVKKGKNINILITIIDI